MSTRSFAEVLNNPNREREHAINEDAYRRGCHQAVSMARDWLLDHPDQDWRVVLFQLEFVLQVLREEKYPGAVLHEAKARLTAVMVNP
jgi:hypothetical protein